jgi:hypothetical protein
VSVHFKRERVNITDISIFVFLIKFCFFFCTFLFEPVTDGASPLNVRMQEAHVENTGQRIGYFERAISLSSSVTLTA